ncbi:lipoprotein [Streptomyces meridianus]|uniref:Lipoprotein n=1 Tax=Streptomyces meridianus TaxID=2938945 RepID=A0ABT0X475_9ACTN|nr:lipoprotein [Streptomyces meridianus]MCM2577214.1 lipoprotein [Streptomyces meridianus]
MKRIVPALLLAGAALVLTGCAGGAGQATGPDAHRTRAAGKGGEGSGTEAVPAGCPSGPGRSLPDAFPQDLPVPDDAVVTGVESRSDHRLVVDAVTRGGFADTLSFLQKRLPKAGYRLAEGEVEEHDAESDFSSAQVRGRWAIREMPDCENGVFLTYLTAPR